jgi:hypothetical protein
MAAGEGLIQKTVTILSGSSGSDSIRVPRNCTVATVFTPGVLAVPQFVVPNGLGDEQAAWRVQSMVPTSNNTVDDIAWVDVMYWVPGDFVLRPLAFPFAANIAMSFPSWMLGGGQIRFETFGITQPAAVSFTIFFSSFNN